MPPFALLVQVAVYLVVEQNFPHVITCFGKRNLFNRDFAPGQFVRGDPLLDIARTPVICREDQDYVLVEFSPQVG